MHFSFLFSHSLSFLISHCLFCFAFPFSDCFLSFFLSFSAPLDVITFWRERNARLSALFEQLTSPKVKKIQSILERCSSEILTSFTSEYNDLIKIYSEAKENVKFLTTLERHFKNLSIEMNNQNYQDALVVIADTIPSMMDALRMVRVEESREDGRQWEPVMGGTRD